MVSSTPLDPFPILSSSNEPLPSKPSRIQRKGSFHRLKHKVKSFFHSAKSNLHVHGKREKKSPLDPTIPPLILTTISQPPRILPGQTIANSKPNAIPHAVHELPSSPNSSRKSMTIHSDISEISPFHLSQHHVRVNTLTSEPNTIHTTFSEATITQPGFIRSMEDPTSFSNHERLNESPLYSEEIFHPTCSESPMTQSFQSLNHEEIAQNEFYDHQQKIELSRSNYCTPRSSYPENSNWFDPDPIYPSFTYISASHVSARSTPSVAYTHSIHSWIGDHETVFSHPYDFHECLSPEHTTFRVPHFIGPEGTLPTLNDPKCLPQIPLLEEADNYSTLAMAAEPNTEPAGSSPASCSMPPHGTKFDVSSGEFPCDRESTKDLEHHRRIDKLMNYYENQMAELAHNYHAQMSKLMTERNQSDMRVIYLEDKLTNISSSCGKLLHLNSVECQTEESKTNYSASKSGSRFNVTTADDLAPSNMHSHAENLEKRCRSLEKSNTHLAAYLLALHNKLNHPRLKEDSPSQACPLQERQFIHQILSDLDDLMEDYMRGIKEMPPISQCIGSDKKKNVPQDPKGN